MLGDTETACRRHAELVSALDGIGDIGAMPALAAEVRGFLVDASANGLDGLAVAQLIAQLNDRLTCRVIDLTAKRHRLPPVAWCWLALGSEGRHEQTFVTDQDNGLIFNATSPQEATALRERFLPFAAEVNQRLAEAGFALCPGKIMAGNPECCLSLDEWRERFIDWVRRPEPQALLNGSIFFDLRPLCGDRALGAALRAQCLSLTQATPAFLHLMAANALQAEPPLNFRGEALPADDGSLDLKKFGTRIFVDAARIMALASGVEAVTTAERLRRAGLLAGLSAQAVEAAEAAFSHLLRLRLSSQTRGDGIFRPKEAHDMDRAILREALHQARRLQQRLKLNYQL
jgi:CBS domain-containing protein